MAQISLMDYTQGERAITHHVGPVQIGGCQRLQMQPRPTASRAFRSTEKLELINFWSPTQ
jgi:hypothetical protein